MLFLLKLKCLRQYRVLLCDLNLLSLVEYILYSSTLDILFERKWVLNILCLVFIFLFFYFVIHSFVKIFLFRPTNIFFWSMLVCSYCYSFNQYFWWQALTSWHICFEKYSSLILAQISILYNSSLQNTGKMVRNVHRSNSRDCLLVKRIRTDMIYQGCSMTCYSGGFCYFR